MTQPILITGAAGRLGAVGRKIVENLRQRGLPVRALVRSEDERSDSLRSVGAEIATGDLTRATDVVRALEGCTRMFFGMSVSAQYLEATVVAAAVARECRNLEVFVNISQMTVSQMSITQMTDSPQQRQQWLGEQVLNWSGIPVVNVRATVFLQHFFFSEWAAESIARDNTIRLPFGTGRTSPVDAGNVADVIAEILVSPTGHIGKIYELTGPRSQDMCRLTTGAIRSFATAVCLSICMSTLWRWPSFMPPIVMTVSPKKSKQSQEIPPRAPEPMLRVTPTCSSITA
jgi:NAD(P)H dehydrogenase (quinone)